MIIKILKKGDLIIPQNIKRFSCADCGCVFEADSSEYTLANQLEAMHDGIIAKCECPTCSRMVYLYGGDNNA